MYQDQIVGYHSYGKLVLFRYLHGPNLIGNGLATIMDSRELEAREKQSG